jgi:hypothetical protein
MNIKGNYQRTVKPLLVKKMRLFLVKLKTCLILKEEKY